MFEKIHSDQLRHSLLVRMNETNKFLLPISIHEKQWLKAALKNENASLFLTEETKTKLATLLEETVEPAVELIREKGRVEPLTEQQGITEIHQSLRQMMRNKQGFVLSYQLNDGEILYSEGFPYKLEFFVQKQQWYVLWVKKEHEETYLISTPLPNIVEVTSTSIDELEYDRYVQKSKALVEGDKQKATIALNAKLFDRQDIDQNRHRIFYAFSCFDKEIVYDEEQHYYEIIVYYRENEKYDLLQKLRFLGNRVIVKEPKELRVAMKNTALDALKRYESN